MAAMILVMMVLALVTLMMAKVMTAMVPNGPGFSVSDGDPWQG